MQLTSPRVVSQNYTDDTYTLAINCTDCEREYQITVSGPALFARNRGASVQVAFPELTPAERELFFMTGICGECFAKMAAAWKAMEDEESESGKSDD